jgi:succinate-semialdehyde dehydrogenase / glutarate-semialdehyde dehydrogenase
MIATVNPATNETLKTFEPLTEPQIEEKLQRAADTFRSYRWSSFAEREPLMLRAAEILESEKNEFGRLMTLEMGKPVKGAVQEAEKCAWVCRYYAENASQHLADEVISTNASQSYVSFQPALPE